MSLLILALDIPYVFSFVHVNLVLWEEPWLLIRSTKEPCIFEWATQNGGIAK